MEIQQKKQIVSAIISEMEQKGLSQNAWAAKKGISKSHMSNILKPENWEKVGERTWNDLSNKVAAMTNGSVYKTKNLQIIHNACQDAQLNKRVVAIGAYTGAGKTTALKQYDSTNANAHYLVCRSSFGVKDLAIRIARAMGVQSKGGRVLDVEDAIIDQLNSGTDSLLILDSVSKLRKDAALQFIGDLCEATENKAGIILSGTEFFSEYMEKMVSRNKRGFREFDRRIFAWANVPRFKDEKVQKEAIKICQEHGIWENSKITRILKEATCFGTLFSAINRMQRAIKN